MQSYHFSLVNPLYMRRYLLYNTALCNRPKSKLCHLYKLDKTSRLILFYDASAAPASALGYSLNPAAASAMKNRPLSESATATQRFGAK